MYLFNAPRVWMLVLASILVMLTATTAWGRQQTITLWASSVPDVDGWVSASQAAGDPGCTEPCASCTSTNPLTYAINSYPQNPSSRTTAWLTAAAFQSFSLPPGTCVTGLQVDALVRYGNGDNGQMDIQLIGTGYDSGVVTTGSFSSNTTCRFQPRTTSDFTGASPETFWTEARINSLQFRVRRVLDSSNTDLIIKAFRLRVTVSPVDAPTGITTSANDVPPLTNVTLTAQGGSGSVVRWYTGTCGGTLVGAGPTFSVVPTGTTTYYARWERECAQSACASIEVRVQAGFGQAVPIPFGLNVHTQQTNFDAATVTVEAWVRAHEFNTNHGEPVVYAGGNGRAWQLYLVDAGSLQMTAAFVVGSGSATSGPILTRGMWYHLAGTYDGQYIRMYVDGNLVATTPWTAGIPGAGTSPQIQLAVKMRCDIDDLRIWSGARGQDEIQCDISTPLTVLPSGLRGYWTFDNGYYQNCGVGGGGGCTPYWQFPSHINSSAFFQVAIGNTLIPAPSSTSTPPALEAHVDSHASTVAVGHSLALHATPLGTGPFSYSWQVRDNRFAGGWGDLADGYWRVGIGTPVLLVSGSQEQTLSVSLLNTMPGLTSFDFRCRVTGLCSQGVTESTAVSSCSFAEPFGLDTPAAQTAAIGGHVVLHGLRPGTGPYSYRWEVVDLNYPGAWRPMHDGTEGADGELFIATGTGTPTLDVQMMGPGLTANIFRLSATSPEQPPASPCVSSYSSLGTVTTCTSVPAITSQPAATPACISGTASFSVAASNPSGLAYQWQFQVTPGVWTQLSSAPSSFACPSGGLGVAFATPANSPTVNIGIQSCAGIHSYPIRCLVTNACGSTASNPAVLSISCSSQADVAGLGGTSGCDGQITADDLVFYLARFFANDFDVADIVGLGGGSGADGRITADDLVAFLSAFFSGCP